MTSAPIPLKIGLHTKSRILELAYSETESYQLSSEYLRVYSPSAEVRGHGAGHEVLQTGKIDVTIDSIHPVGNYAIQPFLVTVTIVVFIPGVIYTNLVAIKKLNGRSISNSIA